MKLLTFASLTFVSLALVGCQSPTAPSPSPQVRLTMLVIGSTTQTPIQGAHVVLIDADGRGTVQRTGADGRATWLVLPNRSYAISVCGRSAPPSLVTGDAGWLTSLPETSCEVQ